MHQFAYFDVPGNRMERVRIEEGRIRRAHSGNSSCHFPWSELSFIVTATWKEGQEISLFALLKIGGYFYFRREQWKLKSN